MILVLIMKVFVILPALGVWFLLPRLGSLLYLLPGTTDFVWGRSPKVKVI